MNINSRCKIVILLILVTILFCSCFSEPSNDNSDNTVYEEKQKSDVESLLSIDESSLNNYKSLSDIGIIFEEDLQSELASIPTMLDAALYLIKLTDYDKSDSEEYTFPYTDIPDEYDKVIGYLYKNDIIYGVKPNYYGTNTICDSATFIKFTLKLLGYELDSIDNPFSKAISINLISDEYIKQLSNEIFTKGDVINIIYNAMYLATNGGTGDVLANKINKNVVLKKKETLDFDIVKHQTEPLCSVDFNKCNIRGACVYDSNGSNKLKIMSDKINQCNITEDGYFKLLLNKILLGIKVCILIKNQ